LAEMADAATTREEHADFVAEKRVCGVEPSIAPQGWGKSIHGKSGKIGNFPRQTGVIAAMMGVAAAIECNCRNCYGLRIFGVTFACISS
jgi:hypothetical protein